MSSSKSGVKVMRERCHAITKRDGLDNRCKHTTLRGMYCHQHLKVKKGLKIVESELPGAGKGLFTTEPIPEGAVIARYTGDVVIEMDSDYGNPYALMIKENPPTYIDASRTNTAEGRWVNDARNEADANAELHYDPVTKQGYLVATRDIEAGEEIYTDYGPDYWLNKATIPNLAKRRERRPDAVKEVEELQEEPEQPRVRKHIKEPEPEYEPEPPRNPRKPRTKQAKHVPSNAKYVKELLIRLRMMQMLLESEKFVEQLKLKKRRGAVFTIPDLEGTTDDIKELEAVEKKALKQLLAHFSTGPTKITQEKLVSIVDALIQRKKGAGFTYEQQAAANRQVMNLIQAVENNPDTPWAKARH